MNRSDGTEPLIAASAVNGVRHLLLEEGVWDGVRATLVRVHPDASAWIDTDLSVDPTKTAWIPVARYAQMMDALYASAGDERTFALGRARAHRTAVAGAFAPVVRSWQRSFGRDVGEFLKLTFHAWSTQTRHLGEFELESAGAGRARFVLRAAPRVVAECIGWQRFLAGYATGLLDLIERRGLCEIRMDSEGKDMLIVYRYDTDPPPGGPA